MPRELTPADQAFLIEALCDPLRWSGATGPVEHIETHISHVLLVGEHAYKIKKPLDLGFLDYSTLARRRFCCDEEIRLNRRTAPEIYLDVLPIGGDTGNPTPGTGEPIEYAVRMRRFPQDATLDQLLDARRLRPTHIDAAVDAMASLHAEATVAEPPFGEPESVMAPVRQNVSQIRALMDEPEKAGFLNEQARWTEEQYIALAAAFEARRRAGRVRECHGDLHLGNLAEVNGRVLAFDGIEFNPQLRFIDVMSELAFLAMDLDARGQSALARRAVNRYLEITGDFDGLKVLDFYKHYRAMVRAKVSAIRRAQTDAGIAERLSLTEQFGAYLALAQHITTASKPAVLLTHGVSGSGKSMLASALVEALPRAIRLRSDVERKRLFGLAAEMRSGSTMDGGLYTADATERTYARLLALAETVLDAGYMAIVDATFLEHRRRNVFLDLAQRLGVGFAILSLDAPQEQLRARVASRHAEGGDPSEADVAVLEKQLAHREPLAREELGMTVTVDASEGWDPAQAAAALAEKWA